MPQNLHFHQTKNCLICNKSQFKKWGITSYKHYLAIRPDLDNEFDPIKKYPEIFLRQITLLQCRSCSFIFSTPQLSSNSLSLIYEQNGSYFSHYQNENATAIKALKASYKVEITQLEKFKSDGNLIDIGCSGGLFMNSLNSQFKLTGLDIDQSALSAARKRLGKKVTLINSPLEESNLPNDYYDVAIMRGIIEHVSNPHSFLKKASKILKRDGLLFINTPNIDSICAQLYKENFRLIDPIHHIWYFSPKTIKNLLEKYGFRITKINYNYFNTPYFQLSNVFTIFQDWFSLKVINKKPKHASPPFYGNFMDIYAYKVL